MLNADTDKPNSNECGKIVSEYVARLLTSSFFAKDDKKIQSVYKISMEMMLKVAEESELNLGVIRKDVMKKLKRYVSEVKEDPVDKNDLRERIDGVVLEMISYNDEGATK